MSYFTKKMLITLLIISSNATANISGHFMPSLPTFDANVQNFGPQERLTWNGANQSQLNFSNDADFTLKIALNYKRRNKETKNYEKKEEYITLKPGEKKSAVLNGDDAFVRVSAYPFVLESSNHDYVNISLCSYNNKYSNYNETAIASQKDITFKGTRNNLKAIFPDLSKKGYYPLNLWDIACWNSTPPTELRIYDDVDLAGDYRHISTDTRDLKTFNNKMSSYVIPRDWTVTFYEGTNYTGSSYTRTISYDTDQEINDKIKSLKIVKKF